MKTATIEFHELFQACGYHVSLMYRGKVLSSWLTLELNEAIEQAKKSASFRGYDKVKIKQV